MDNKTLEKVLKIREDMVLIEKEIALWETVRETDNIAVVPISTWVFRNQYLVRLRKAFVEMKDMLAEL